MKLPDGWEEIDGTAAAEMEKELRREAPAGHQLKDLIVRAIARRYDRDDVLFKSGSGVVYAVHLTYSVETDPRWPSLQRYESLAAFCEQWSDD